eukprot:m.52588 g.52588  ORF g.52588 m.52588 type:complete len:176 (-) comp11001_c2_seq6:1128-1655(-)
MPTGQRRRSDDRSVDTQSPLQQQQQLKVLPKQVKNVVSALHVMVWLLVVVHCTEVVLVQEIDAVEAIVGFHVALETVMVLMVVLINFETVEWQSGDQLRQISKMKWMIISWCIDMLCLIALIVQFATVSRRYDRYSTLVNACFILLKCYLPFTWASFHSASIAITSKSTFLLDSN